MFESLLILFLVPIVLGLGIATTVAILAFGAWLGITIFNWFERSDFER